MPDLADVEQGLLAVLSQALFNLPLSTNDGVLITDENGVQLLASSGVSYLPMDLQPSVTGTLLRLYRGWPTSTNMAQEVREDKNKPQVAHVTVFADTAMARNTTRYMPRQGVPIPPPPLTMSITVRNGHAIINGTPNVGQVCGLLIGPTGSGQGYAYRIQAGDTPQTVAAALAALIPNATPTGRTIALPIDIAVGRVGQDVQVGSEIRRQEQVFRLTFWCPNPQIRDRLVAAADNIIAPLTRLQLASGWTCYVRYHGTRVEDVPSLAGVWRRDLVYSVEYPTTPTITATEMLFGVPAIGSTPIFDV